MGSAPGGPDIKVTRIQNDEANYMPKKTREYSAITSEDMKYCSVVELAFMSSRKNSHINKFKMLRQ